MAEKYTRDDLTSLLKDKQAELSASGSDRYPSRADFTDEEVCAIKAQLGPWPRALEAAGLKPPRGEDRLRLNREKRQRAKRNRRINKASDENN